jgi:hypothetical protein
MSVMGQLASQLRYNPDADFTDTFDDRFTPSDPFAARFPQMSAAEAAALRTQRGVLNRQQGSGAERGEKIMGGLADLTMALGEPVTRIGDYSRSRVGTEGPITEEDVFRQDLASRNIGKGIAQAGAYGLPVKNPAAAAADSSPRARSACLRWLGQVR